MSDSAFRLIAVATAGIALTLASTAHAQGACDADANGDGVVNGSDLTVVLSGWGSCTSGAACAGDINDDGSVDGTDLTALLAAWGPCVTLPSWASMIEAYPDPAIVHNAALRQAIAATGLAWRVRDNDTQIELVLIPPGTFQMGCSVSNAYLCSSNEGPVHTVTLTSAFYIGRYEVTQAQWQARMGSNPSLWRNPSPEVPASEVPNRPVDTVSWDTIQTFLNANSLQGSGGTSALRLPTEAEWEYACRAGTVTGYHSLPGYPDGTNDDQLASTIAWWGSCPPCGGNSGHQTHPVGRKAGNGFGLHDMAGNAYEWVNDLQAPYPQGPVVDPTGPSTGTTRILRGGSFADARTNLRSSKRMWYPPNHPSNRFGFRVARNP
jgi:formylglycine-generating enzyme required for sulfatase activity